MDVDINADASIAVNETLDVSLLMEQYVEDLMEHLQLPTSFVRAWILSNASHQDCDTTIDYRRHHLISWMHHLSGVERKGRAKKRTRIRTKNLREMWFHIIPYSIAVVCLSRVIHLGVKPVFSTISETWGKLGCFAIVMFCVSHSFCYLCPSSVLMTMVAMHTPGLFLPQLKGPKKMVDHSMFILCFAVDCNLYSFLLRPSRIEEENSEAPDVSTQADGNALLEPREEGLGEEKEVEVEMLNNDAVAVVEESKQSMYGPHLHLR